MRGYRKFAIMLIVIAAATFMPLNAHQASVLVAVVASVSGGTAIVEFAKAWGVGRNSGRGRPADDTGYEGSENEH